MLINKQSSFNRQELLDCGNGRLFGAGNAQLPLPDMLMFDRIIESTMMVESMVRGSHR